VVHDDIYVQTERDPWVFYECGKNNLVVITSDTAFMKSFPHRAAIAIAKTTFLAFSQNNCKFDVRGNALIKAHAKINDAILKHKKLKKNFIAIIGMTGSFAIKEESPIPHRKTCDPRDWESYERVCSIEGVLALAPAH
jgi:hypothetical protein